MAVEARRTAGGLTPIKFNATIVMILDSTDSTPTSAECSAEEKTRDHALIGLDCVGGETVMNLGKRTQPGPWN
jgi:hypothetical protein